MMMMVVMTMMIVLVIIDDDDGYDDDDDNYNDEHYEFWFITSNIFYIFRSFHLNPSLRRSVLSIIRKVR